LTPDTPIRHPPDGGFPPADESLLDPPPPTVRDRAGNTAAGIVVAAMLGVGEVLEPEKVSAPIEIIGEAPLDEPLIDLDFVLEDLPPL